LRVDYLCVSSFIELKQRIFRLFVEHFGLACGKHAIRRIVESCTAVIVVLLAEDASPRLVSHRLFSDSYCLPLPWLRASRSVAIGVARTCMLPVSFATVIGR
jgi:hypothetical protein